MSVPLHINIDDVFLNDLSSNSTYSSSQNSNLNTISLTTSSYENDTTSISIIPLSNTNYSPQRTIPLANRISNIVSNAVPLNNYNYATHLIFFLNLFIFIFYMYQDGNKLSQINPENEYINFYAYSPFPSCENKKYQYWRLISYSFVHSGFAHLIGNTLLLYMSSIFFYNIQNFFNILVLYYRSIINSALFFYVNKPYNGLHGSSGGSFAFFGANIGNLLLNYDKANSFSIKVNLFFILFFIFFDILSFLFLFKENTAYQVHWASLLYGILYAFSSFKVVKNTKNKRYLKYLSIILMCYYNCYLLLNYIYYSPPLFQLNYFKLEKPDHCCGSYLQLNNIEKNKFICQPKSSSTLNFI
jgi:membrane associated rhomboid family serine protease